MKDKVLAIRPLLNVHLIICFCIGWMVTNGWAYFMLAAGVWVHNAALTAIASGYLALLWLPFTPEKIITFMIAALLMKKLFPQDLYRANKLFEKLVEKKEAHSGRHYNKNANHITLVRRKAAMKKTFKTLCILTSVLMMMTSCGIGELIDGNFTEKIQSQETNYDSEELPADKNGVFSRILNRFGENIDESNDATEEASRDSKETEENKNGFLFLILNVFGNNPDSQTEEEIKSITIRTYSPQKTFYVGDDLVLNGLELEILCG